MSSNQEPSADPTPDAGAGRPSLLDGANTRDQRPHSILDALGGTDSPDWPAASAPRRLGWAIATVGVVFAAGLAWMKLHPELPQPAIDTRASLQATADPLAGVAAPATAARVSASAPPLSVAAAALAGAAGIEVLPDVATTGQGGTERVGAGAFAFDATPAGTSAGATSGSRAAGEKPRPKPPSAPARAAAASKPEAARQASRPRERPADRKPSRQARGKPAPAATAADQSDGAAVAARSAVPAPSLPVAASTRRDADVEIVSALMSYIEGQPVAEPSLLAVPAAATVPMVPPPGVAPDNIADLVASCRSAGGADAALACRRRICRGYWGKAEACPLRDRKATERTGRELQARGSP